LGKAHRQILIPTREPSKARIALIAAYAFLKLVSGKVLHELRKNGLANVHPSLSRARRPRQHVLKRTREKLKKVRIEKSQIPRNLLTQSDLFAIEKV
jgi:prophage antirepressor-like protein